jgi:hypothetical protein
MDKSDWHNSDPPGNIDPAYFANSSLREKIIEHLFVGELLRTLWQRGARRVELLRAEVDAGGYDLVLECNGIIRHIQLKSSYRGTKSERPNIRVVSKSDFKVLSSMGDLACALFDLSENAAQAG